MSTVSKFPRDFYHQHYPDGMPGKRKAVKELDAELVKVENSEGATTPCQIKFMAVGKANLKSGSPHSPSILLPSFQRCSCGGQMVMQRRPSTVTVYTENGTRTAMSYHSKCSMPLCGKLLYISFEEISCDGRKVVHYLQQWPY